MSNIVIKINNIGKKYVLGQNVSYQTIRESFLEFFKNISHKKSSNNNNEFWALKNISFSVNQGDLIGIIGRNGAGKSTLLKIISRITLPTEGSISVKGRIASLLEVGTGFHPELTGRENIFLSGSILGMKREEIEERFNSIVEFSELERFIETPVKRYSSGMYVRLAFAVAAHLDPDILLVDEVLAVGDVNFQKKCLGKMEGLGKGGKTVLFVSHNIGAITQLTTRCLWIDNGSVRENGPTNQVVSHYLAEGYKNNTIWKTNEYNSNFIQITGAEIRADNGQFTTNSNLEITVEYIIRKSIIGAVISVIIHSSDGSPLIGIEDIDSFPELLESRETGTYRDSVIIPGDWLSSGKYYLRLHSGVPGHVIYDNIEAMNFELTDIGNPKIREHKKAYLLPYLQWNVEKIRG